MEDELISFRVAKLAKEKRFQEMCVNCYNEEGRLYTPQTSGSLLYHSNIIDDNSYSAPTQSLLQRWLREVKNLILTMGFHNDDDTNYQCTVWDRNEGDGEDVGLLWTNSYNTYEETLEEGLYEALLLIK